MASSGISKRVEWIDVMRGFCMLSVIAGHTGSELLGVYHLYQVYVFTILLGMTFRLTSHNKNREYFRTKIKNAIFYFIKALIIVTVAEVIGLVALRLVGVVSIEEFKTYTLLTLVTGVTSLVGIFDLGYTHPIWYLGCTVALYIVLYGYTKIGSKVSKIVAVVTLAILNIIGTLCFVDIDFIPCSLRSLSVLAVWAVFGYEIYPSISRFIEKLSISIKDFKEKHSNIVVLLQYIVAVLILIGMYALNPHITNLIDPRLANVCNGDIKLYITQITVTLFVSLVVMVVFGVIHNKNSLSLTRAMEWVGVNSAEVLIIHSIFSFITLPFNLKDIYYINNILNIVVVVLVVKVRGEIERNRHG